jgi:hypothetical protein
MSVLDFQRFGSHPRHEATGRLVGAGDTGPHDYDDVVNQVAAASRRVPKWVFEPALPAVVTEGAYPFELYHRLRTTSALDLTGGAMIERAPVDIVICAPGQQRLIAVIVVVSDAPLTSLRSAVRRLHWVCDVGGCFGGALILYGDAGDPRKLAARIRAAGARGRPWRCSYIYNRQPGDAAPLELHP